jgi:hypothetical protein
MRYFRFACWVPFAAWIYARSVVDRYDGWGAWAAAPLLLLPVAVSALFVGVGLFLVGRRDAGRPSSWDWIAIGASSLPLLWIAVRLIAN